MKHHFIPRFLLSCWALDNGRLWRFNRPVAGKIARKLVFPAEAGYERHLYATPGVPEDRKQWLEERFMSPLDDQAAQAHRMLLSGRAETMPVRERSAWSRFIMSQWFRTPDGVKYFKLAMENLLHARNEMLEARYSEIRTKGQPETLAAWIGSMGPDFMERVAMDLLRRMSDDPANGQRLNDMQWSVLNVAAGGRLLVSDAALQHSEPGAFTPEGFLTMPIAPDRLFVATNRRELTDAFHNLPAEALVKQINAVVVRRATAFVGAADLTMETFIRENFGVEVNETYIKTLADVYLADAGGKCP